MYNKKYRNPNWRSSGGGGVQASSLPSLSVWTPSKKMCLSNEHFSVKRKLSNTHFLLTPSLKCPLPYERYSTSLKKTLGITYITGRFRPAVIYDHTFLIKQKII